MGEHMTMKLTALAPSAMKSRRWPTSAKVSGEEWKIYPVVPQYIPTDADLEGKYDETGLPRACDADRGDARRARHVRGEPNRFVSVRFETHNGNDQGVDCVGPHQRCF